MHLENLTNQYRHNVNQWLTSNKYEVTEHIKDIIVSILLHRDRIIDHGGSFVQAFMANNLKDVIRFADNDVMNSLRIIYQAYANIDTYYAAKAYREIIVLEQQQTTL